MGLGSEMAEQGSAKFRGLGAADKEQDIWGFSSRRKRHSEQRLANPRGALGCRAQGLLFWVET